MSDKLLSASIGIHIRHISGPYWAVGDCLTYRADTREWEWTPVGGSSTRAISDSAAYAVLAVLHAELTLNIEYGRCYAARDLAAFEDQLKEVAGTDILSKLRTPTALAALRERTAPVRTT